MARGAYATLGGLVVENRCLAHPSIGQETGRDAREPVPDSFDRDTNEGAHRPEQLVHKNAEPVRERSFVRRLLRRPLPADPVLCRVERCHSPLHGGSEGEQEARTANWSSGGQQWGQQRGTQLSVAPSGLGSTV